eukprot:ANDGO_04104.mRNA.1 hypothetical protein
MEGSIRTIWAREDRLCGAIGTDLPRLAKKFRIYQTSSPAPVVSLGERDPNHDEEPTDYRYTSSVYDAIDFIRVDNLEGMQSYPKLECVIHVLEILLSVLDHDSTKSIQVSSLLQSARIDVATEFFENIVRLAGGTECFRVLKAANQSCIAPAASTFKLYAMHEDFPCRDVQGHWEVAVYIFSDAVHVVQSRKEQTMDLLPKNVAFVCRWQLRLMFDRSVSQMTAVQFGVDQRDIVFKFENDPEGHGPTQKDKDRVFSFLGQISEKTYISELYLPPPPARVSKNGNEDEGKHSCCSLQ